MLPHSRRFQPPLSYDIIADLPIAGLRQAVAADIIAVFTAPAFDAADCRHAMIRRFSLISSDCFRHFSSPPYAMPMPFSMTPADISP
jgi:hypothetical protein